MEFLNKYRIVWDERNVVLQIKRHRTIKKDGVMKEHESWERHYYPSLKIALKKVIDEEARDVPDVSTLLERWDTLEKIIKNLEV